ncbi:MAG: hypothetical protein CMJ57_08650 [Planctomycetaceae bacterium]|nr:hypothetical protein [Planctomycetaceae bacterium]
MLRGWLVGKPAQGAELMIPGPWRVQNGPAPEKEYGMNVALLVQCWQTTKNTAEAGRSVPLDPIERRE